MFNIPLKLSGPGKAIGLIASCLSIATILVILAMADSSYVLAEDQSVGLKPASSDSCGLHLIDWNSYMKMFNKKYTSVTQALVRQKLFMAQVMQVYITSIKYRTYLSSYYTKINQFSDITPQESRQIMSGESAVDDDRSQDMDQLLMDDIEAERALLELLQENDEFAASGVNSVKHYLKRKSSKRIADKIESRRRRRKRSATEQSEARPTRDICMGDLIAKPDDAAEDRLQQATKIRWVVPPTNPDYEPIEMTSFAAAATDQSDKIYTPQDLPPDVIEQVEASLKEEQSSAGMFDWIGNPISSAYNLIACKFESRTEPAQQQQKTRQFRSTTEYEPPVKEAQKKAVEEPIDIVAKDWRDSGCIRQPMNQRPLTCSSCYAVSATSYLEWKFCMNQDRVLTPLSTQYMVSCGPQFRNETDGKMEFHGCNKGRSRHTVDFIKEYGAELEANMPYVAEDTPCPVEPYTPQKYKGYIRPNVGKTIRLSAKTKQLDLALEVGPVIVSFREPKNFLFYGGGMIEHCYDAGGHSMLIVGHGVEAGVEYLIIKNSFGHLWGQGGYFKFRRSSIVECVKEFISPVMSFPSRKSQARRIRAYHASKYQQSQVPSSSASSSSLLQDSSIGLDGTILFRND